MTMLLYKSRKASSIRIQVITKMVTKTKVRCPTEVGEAKYFLRY